MELELVLNELSCEEPSPSVDLARQHIESFVRTMVAATQRGVKRRIRSTCDLQNLVLGPNYHWWDWLKDTSVQLELKQYFRLIATKYPALSGESAIEKEVLGCDYFHGERKATGLGIACRLDSLAVSMTSSDAWNSTSISIDVEELGEEEIERHSDKVRHACRPEHVDRHSDWIRQRLRSIVKDGSELWRRSAEFFPNLQFCEIVATQMAAIPKGGLSSVMRGLFILNKYTGGWQSGNFDKSKVECDVSPDSSQTMNQFAAERTFLCPDGIRREFSWHAKLGSLRIYFDPSGGPSRLLIGYVGPHLRTAKFR